MQVSQDATLHLKETIKVHFDEPRHGLLRDIPCRYERFGNAYSVILHLESVEDENRTKLPFSTSNQADDLTIKIGDANILVSGDKTYIISYTVVRAVNFFNGQPEIYWNVTGDRWPYQIKKVSFKIDLPVQASEIPQAATFVGPPGSTDSGLVDTSKADKTITFTCGTVDSGSGLTVGVRLPAGSINKPNAVSELLFYLMDWYPALLLPLFVFIYMYQHWWRTGRDQGGGGPIPVDFEPPRELSPSQVGVVIDEVCDLTDVLATIVDLAVRGYLRIVKIGSSGNNYRFERLFARSSTEIDNDKKYNTSYDDKNLKNFERSMLRHLFDCDEKGDFAIAVDLVSLKERFYVHISTLKQEIYQSLIDLGSFKRNPDAVRGQFNLLGVLLAVASIILFACSQAPYSVSLGLGLMLSAIITCAFAKAMPARTLMGSKQKRQCLGFGRFVMAAEKSRIEKLAKEDPTLFGRLLPYAMVLGAASQWAQAFKDLNLAPEQIQNNWYVYDQVGYFDPLALTIDLGQSMRSMSYALTAPPPSSSAGGAAGGGSFTSSGGGFSGGGFGGGGGGSW
jgi:uncharacterized membrane protein YgcG